YGTNTKPIEWVRVHNLPDLAYFNHSQHVKVGGLECETCHGPIKEMEVVYQYSPLTMGWCINCHRETNVNAKGNGYYTNLVELHEESKGKQPMKVEDIGGLECSKCHY
ncbi:MAG: cytochrome c3 family protein, partial [Bacteroidota bacterium]